MTVAAFGYKTQTATVTITAGRPPPRTSPWTALRRSVSAAPSTDGSGHGWPLYAKVSVEGGQRVRLHHAEQRPLLPELPSGDAYSLKVESQYPGYQTVSQPITVGDGNATKNIAVPVDGTTCTAPGYKFGSDGVYETSTPVPCPRAGPSSTTRATARSGSSTTRATGATCPVATASSRSSTVTGTAPAARRTRRWSARSWT